MNSTSRDFGQKKRIVVKVGSSTISHATGKLNYQRMEHLVRELADLQNQGKQMILVSSGATNAGLAPLHMDHRPRSIRENRPSPPSARASSCIRMNGSSANTARSSARSS